MNTQTESIQMLNDIYQTAEMGAKALSLLTEKSKDDGFCQKLQAYLSRYDEIKDQSAYLLSQKGEKPKAIKNIDKAGLWMGINMNTLIDKTPSHFAEMLIEGSTKGIIEAVRQKNIHASADFETMQIADKFLELQQAHIDDMKQYLR